MYAEGAHNCRETRIEQVIAYTHLKWQDTLCQFREVAWSHGYRHGVIQVGVTCQMSHSSQDAIDVGMMKQIGEFPIVLLVQPLFV